MKKILKFSASWCGPCKALSKTLSNISTSISIEEIDIDKNEELTKQFKIRGVPTLVMIENDVEIKRSVGYKEKAELENWINN